MRDFALVSLLVLQSCGTTQTPLPRSKTSIADLLGDQSLRETLFEDIVAKTMAREAWSSPKNARLGLDVESALLACRDRFVDATTEHDLLLAIVELSCARRDRHLSVGLVDGGLRPADNQGSRYAPMRFAVDYGTPGKWSCFVSEVPLKGAPAGVEVGDVVVGVGELDFEEWRAAIAPFLRSSTEAGLWREFAKSLTRSRPVTPAALRTAMAKFRLRKDDGSEIEVESAWADDDDDFEWAERSLYSNDFEPVLDVQTFDLYRHRTKPVLLLDWYGFREDLVDDMNRLMELARREGWLDHSIIWDGTKSRGGSRGAYAVQRLFAKPFKTTFGNLRLSDTTPRFIEKVKRRHARRRVEDSGVAETMDQGNWLLDWLTDDVTKGIARGQAYSNNVPFKLAHLPKYSDGIIQPAPIHFRGRAVCLLGPYGGSHLDQFASIVVDNGLAHTIGMSTGGYSNTWEWEEVVTVPGSDQPLVEFMWSIGHTIRPNGDVLEGNPAEVDQLVPVTRDNHNGYRRMLVDLALNHLESEPGRSTSSQRGR